MKIINFVASILKNINIFQNQRILHHDKKNAEKLRNKIMP